MKILERLESTHTRLRALLMPTDHEQRVEEDLGDAIKDLRIAVLEIEAALLYENPILVHSHVLRAKDLIV